jgi:hypothetical protein
MDEKNLMTPWTISTASAAMYNSPRRMRNMATSQFPYIDIYRRPTGSLCYTVSRRLLTLTYICPEDGRMSFQNAGIYLQVHISPQPRTTLYIFTIVRTSNHI